MRRPAGPLTLLCSCLWAGQALCAPAAPASPQGADTAATVSIIPDPRPAGGIVRRVLYGAEYRELWTHPATVAVLDPATFAGGLTAAGDQPDSSGRSLRFDGADGRVYVFRSLSLAARPLRGEHTILDLPRRQDSESSAHPAAAVIAGGVQEAAGLLHAHPVLVVLPDDAALGASRAAFAGRPGIIEELFRASDGATGGATRIAGTRAVLDSLRARPGNRVDSRGFLAARLVDFVLGDFAEGAGDWQWTRAGDGPGALWRPISPDADRRLTDSAGLVRAHFGRTERPTSGARGALALDRELLVDLDAATWDSVATAVQARLGGDALAHAVNAMPAQMRPRSAVALLETLTRRRLELVSFARDYDRRLNEAVDISTTAAGELAVIDQLDDQHLEVALRALGGKGAPPPAPHFRRRFARRETAEVRLHLRGAGDRVVVRGSGHSGIAVRIVREGAGGALADSSHAGGVRLYDVGSAVQVEGPQVVARDERPFVAVATTSPREDRATRVSPDYGAASTVSYWRGVGSWGGFFLGGQYSVERFGFRQPRFASRTSLRAGYSPRLGGFEIDLSHEDRRENSGLSGALLLRVSRDSRVRFRGTSNQTPSTSTRVADAYSVPRTFFELAPSIAWETPARVAFTAGLPLKLVRLDQAAAGDSVRAMHLQGWGSRRQVGGQLGIAYGRDIATERQRTLNVPGAEGDLVGTYYLGGHGLTGGYGTLEGSLALQLGVPDGAPPTLSLRAGGKKVWGAHPFDEAAFLGGRLGLPGIPEQQYAGDASVFAVTEEGLRIARVRFPLRGSIGLLALEESGRVFVPGEISSRWHSAAGPGIWFSRFGSRGRVSLTYVLGEQRDSLYLRGGLGF